MKIALSLLLYLITLPLVLNGESFGERSLQSREGRGVEIMLDDTLYYRPLVSKPMDGDQAGGAAQGVEANFGYLNAWMGRQVKLVVGSAPYPYSVVVNGKQVAYSPSGATPAKFNITRKLTQGVNRVELLYSDYSGRELIEGWSADTQRGVEGLYLISQPTLHIDDLWHSTTLSEGEQATATVKVALRSTALGLQQGRVDYELLAPSGESLARGSRNVQAQLRGADTVTLSALISSSQLWSEDEPKFLKLNLINRRGGRVLERMSFDLGVRSVKLLDDKSLEVNGKPVQLRAKRVAADISQQELEEFKGEGYNTFVIDAGRYSEWIYRWADSVGAYLIPTAAINSSKGGDVITVGGNPSNDPAWREVYIERGEDVFHATKSHPSVIGFAIAQGSMNGDNLYQSYLNLKGIGDSRPTIYLDGGGEWNSDNIDLLWE